MGNTAHFQAKTVHPRRTLAVIALAGLSVSMLSTILLPALPVMQEKLHSSATGVTWLLTAFFLSGAVSTGIIGRFGDMYGKRRMLIVSLALLSAGTLLGALTSSLLVQVVARSIQGFGSAILPLAIAIVRDLLPREKVAGAIGFISALLGVGGALGGTVGGLIVGRLDFHWLFWIPLAVMLVALAGIWAFVPESAIRVPGRVNWLAAALMGTGVGLILLAVSEAPHWGWGSSRTLGLFALGAAACVAWIAVEVVSVVPLVDMAMMRVRGVWTANVAAFLIGAGTFLAFAIVTRLFELPTSTGYGFGASTLVAGLYLLPSTLCSVVLSASAGPIAARIGSKGALICGSGVMAAALGIFVWADNPAAFLVTLGLMGVGIGLTLASLGNLIVQAVEPHQTGVASGMNIVMRMLGGAVGSQLGATIVESNVKGGVPALAGFHESFIVGGFLLVVCMGVALLVPGQARPPRLVGRPAEDALQRAPHQGGPVALGERGVLTERGN